MAYHVDEDVTATLDALDHRERGGYERVETVARAPRGEIPVLVYVANGTNPHFAGEASLDAMVQQILQARGESGPNVEYVLKLDAALREHGVNEPHVHELANALRAHL